MSTAVDLDRVFQALSDSTRRGIIERLRVAPETTGELAEAFPALSRVSVMKHLAVLESAGLVKIRREGRFRWNELERDPLQEANSWLARHYEARRDMAMRLKLVAEEDENGQS